LADVEGALLGCPEVDAAAVVLRADHPDEPRLVAYMVAAASTSPSPAAMRRRLTERLPSHAIPSDFLFLESLPLTAHGKLDRRSLPPPGRRRPQLDTPFTSAASPAETALAALFADVLCKDPIGIHDSFLELGGSSILALRLLARIRAKFGVEVPLPRFFDEPTVAGLARIFEERSLTR
jgi:acyl carrier protein